MRPLFSSFKMALATFLSRILGLIREQMMAFTFGATGMTDAFMVAYRIPNMLRDLFAEGALSQAFVPIFTEVLALPEKEKARRFFWSLFCFLGLITGLISFFIFLNAPLLIEWATDNRFTENQERYKITIQLLRIMAPFLTLISLAALFMGALNSLRIFFVPSLAPAFFNIVMIASMLFLPSWLEEKWNLPPILCLGIGVIGGGIIQMLIQLPLLLKKNLWPTRKISLLSRENKKVAGLLGAGTLGVAGQQINLFVTTILATGTQLGAVSWLSYAFRLFQFPVGVLGVSIANSNLVHFSALWKAQKKKEAISMLKTSYNLSWFCMIPALAFLFILSEETVRLIFERGAFQEKDSLQTALVFRLYLLGLPFYGLYKVFGPTFFALNRPLIPIKISLLSVGANILFCVFLVPFYGFKILALGTTLSIGLNTFFQGLFLKRELKLKFNFFWDRNIFFFFLAGALSSGIIHFLQLLALPLGEFLHYGLLIISGGGSYLFLSLIFRKILCI